ncbi:MAG: thioredoxin family protein [Bacteroidetes bacterium]|nr:thioredoxin family protein [Bacteroidota bacterium]
MALTESNPTIGTQLTHFKLPTVFGNQVSSNDYDNYHVLVVMFLCGHCPYVIALEDRILELAKHFEQNVQFLAICSNNYLDYPEDSPGALAKRHQEKGYTFPYLIDESQQIAKQFDAVCTPDIFVFNSERKLAYHGRIDDNWKQPEMVTKQELKEAINSILKTNQGPEIQHPTIGCSIKWK